MTIERAASQGSVRGCSASPPCGARPDFDGARAYILSRQSRSGAFCFYKTEHVDEPNLHDTHHAVAALALLGVDVPRVELLGQFLNSFLSCEPHTLYYRVFALDLLGCSSLVGAQPLAEAALGVPRATVRTATSGWLETTLKVLLLKRRVGDFRDRPDLIQFIDGLKADGGYGDKPNLWDTYLSLTILALLANRPPEAATAAFVDRLQVPSFGFTLTGDSLLGSLDIVYAGMKCCAMLGVPVRYKADALRFVYACQSTNGGFSRVPDALPDIEMTSRALRILALAEPGEFEKRTSPLPGDRSGARRMLQYLV